MDTAVRLKCFGEKSQKVTLKEKGEHVVAKFLFI
jgi:hypothetical protein